MSIEELNRNMELEEVATNKSDGTTSETKNMIHATSTDQIRFLPGRKLGLDRLILLAILVVLLVILIVVFCILALAASSRVQVVNSNHTVQIQSTSSPCVSVACLEAAVSLLHSINTSTDPCVDFKEFACGQWERNIILPPGSSKFSTFEQINIELLKIQRTLIDSFNVNQGTISEKKLIQFYKSCINTAVINSRGVQPFIDYINRLYVDYGGWQLLPGNHNFSIDTWSFKSLMENVITDIPFVEFEVHDDFKNNEMSQLFIYPSYLMIERALLIKLDNKEVLDEYKKYMRGTLSHFGITMNATLLDNIINLESQIAKTYPDTTEMRNIVDNYHPTTLDQLNSITCPIFNWTRIFETRSIKGDGKGSLKIILISPSQLQKSCEIVKTYMDDIRNRSVLHNYLIWKMLSPSLSYLSDDVQRAKDAFSKYLYGVVGKRPRWELCVTKSLNSMPLVLGNMFVSRYFHKNTRPQVIEMINLLKNQFRENLKQNTWMDKETIKNAIGKINTITPFIGYTDEIVDKNQTDQFFVNIPINEKTFFENAFSLKDYKDKNSYKKAGFPKENTTIQNPLEVNAYYNPARNEIVFPAGILQPPFFDPGVPRSLKYAGIGTAMGHEISHGFDDQGSRFDMSGNIGNWWSDETRRLFNEKSDCFVSQYAAYKVGDKQLNGNLTLGENIADNGGVRLSYQVYKMLQKLYGEEQPLPGVKFNHDQLFFITFARLWCNVETKGSAEHSIRNDPHTPNKYRVIGVLSNMKEFSNAFKCPIGTPMNPYKKCQVW